jgi:general secretion pathway protein I
MNPARKVGQRGFSLLEAVVALVILASAGWALFSWVNASIVSLRRVEDANARSAATSNAVEYMQTVNPMLRPEGRVDLGDYRIGWTSTLITRVMNGSDFQRGPSNYDLALYDTVVRAYQGEGDLLWFEFKLKLVGYKQMRTAVNPFITK